MKLSFFFLFVLMFSGLANDGYSQNEHIRLSYKCKTLQDVIREIEHQSDYNFVYNPGKIGLNKQLTIDFKEGETFEILSHLFEGTDINFRIYHLFDLIKNTIIYEN